jgi:hypothetical protein
MHMAKVATDQLVTDIWRQRGKSALVTDIFQFVWLVSCSCVGWAAWDNAGGRPVCFLRHTRMAQLVDGLSWTTRIAYTCYIFLFSADRWI